MTGVIVFSWTRLFRLINGAIRPTIYFGARMLIRAD